MPHGLFDLTGKTALRNTMHTVRRGAMIVLLIVAAVGFGRFSRQVRNVDAVGLFSSGAIAGVGLSGLFKRRSRRAA